MRGHDSKALSSGRRSGTAAIAGICLAVAAAACGGSDGDAAATTAPSSAVTDAEVTSTTRPDPLAVDDVDGATRERVLSELGAAVEALKSQPVEISLEMLEEGELRTATVRVDQSEGLLDAVWVAPLSSGSAVTTRNVLVDGRAFLKSTTSDAAEAALDYTELPYDTSGPRLLDEVFAGYARVDKTLERILVLLENLPFAAQITDTDEGTEISVIMSPFSIYNYYGESGLESVGGTVPPELTRLAFLVQDGVLRGLVAAGTHFHDGEALEISATILYTPIEPFTLEVPPIQK